MIVHGRYTTTIHTQPIKTHNFDTSYYNSKINIIFLKKNVNRNEHTIM